MSDFKIPDIKGPRCSKKTTKIHGIKFYNNFRKKYPEYKDLTNKELNQILVTFNETLWETVIDYRDGVKLPESIGWLIIASYKKVKKNIDYKKSIEFNKLILNKNWDTDGKVGKIYFTVQSLKYKIYNREFWAFTGCRNFKRTLAKKYVDNHTMYIDGTLSSIRDEYTRARKVLYFKNKDKKDLENYNEFNI